MHIVELQRKLQENRNEIPITKYRARTAAVEDASKLLQTGQFTPEEVSYFRNIPLSVVKREQARLEEIDLARRKYLATMKMELPGEMAHFTIYQK